MLPPVNKNPPEVVDAGAEVVEEPNTKPPGVAWPEVTVLVIALVRLLLPSPKALGFTVA